MPSKKKVAYFAHLEHCLTEYPRAFIVDADFVGSRQLSDIRIALRGKGELLFGKNTMIRRCIRNLTEDGSHEDWESIIGIMRGNLGFIFTHGEFDVLHQVVKDFVKPSAAKAGVIAPVSVTIPKGPTGLDPAQTSFFQALNIATKINKGAIEIINDCTVVRKDEKVGTSEAALLAKLGQKPFFYGLRIAYIYEGGIFSPDILDIDDSVLMRKWQEAVGNVAAISLETGYTTDASVPHLIINAAMDIAGISVMTDYLEFNLATKCAELLKGVE